MAHTDQDQKNRYQLGNDQVRKFLPHRAPFLLVDKILEIHPVGDLGELEASDRTGIRVLGRKCVTFNEPFFQGHFPQYAVMPGVLQIETMAQTASFALYPYMEKDLEKLARDFRCILVGADEVRFRKPVVPGDVLDIGVVVTKCRGRLWWFDCNISVEGHKVAEAKLLTQLTPNG